MSISSLNQLYERFFSLNNDFKQYSLDTLKEIKLSSKQDQYHQIIVMDTILRDNLNITNVLSLSTIKDETLNNDNFLPKDRFDFGGHKTLPYNLTEDFFPIVFNSIIFLLPKRLFHQKGFFDKITTKPITTTRGEWLLKEKIIPSTQYPQTIIPTNYFQNTLLLNSEYPNIGKFLETNNNLLCVIFVFTDFYSTKNIMYNSTYESNSESLLKGEYIPEMSVQFSYFDTESFVQINREKEKPLNKFIQDKLKVDANLSTWIKLQLIDEDLDIINVGSYCIVLPKYQIKSKNGITLYVTRKLYNDYIKLRNAKIQTIFEKYDANIKPQLRFEPGIKTKHPFVITENIGNELKGLLTQEQIIINPQDTYDIPISPEIKFKFREIPIETPFIDRAISGANDIIPLSKIGYFRDFEYDDMSYSHAANTVVQDIVPNGVDNLVVVKFASNLKKIVVFTDYQSPNIITKWRNDLGKNENVFFCLITKNTVENIGIQWDLVLIGDDPYEKKNDWSKQLMLFFDKIRKNNVVSTVK